jgi:hypothetical protein
MKNKVQTIEIVLRRGREEMRENDGGVNERPL